MDPKTAKRIDSLYRNINSFTMLVVLSALVPIFLLFAVPLSLAYLYLRAKLLQDVASGKIVIDQTEMGAAGRANDLTTAQKVDFIRQHDTRLWMPGVIVLGVAAVVIVFMLFIH